MVILGSNKKAADDEITYPFTGMAIPYNLKLIERYPLNHPYAYAVIGDDAAGNRKFYLDEVQLTKAEAKVYSYLLKRLEAELTIPRSAVNPKKYFEEQAKHVIAKYGIKINPISWSKILYYAERDLVGFGVLDALLKDPNIEDISVDGINKPLFIYHRKHESLATNIVFVNDQALDNIIVRLAHMAGRHISTAFPILQGTLPGRHRVLATFRREVSPYGSLMTIRKFREDPLTIIDLLNFRVLDHRMAAYMWLMMENKAPSLVVGATGSGKTTLLNALLTLTRTNTKIVTIEEVQEINIPHPNWSALVTRESYGAGDISSEITLFDLVKAAMRMRPDIIVVGEVRGEEAYVLFSAIATGHGGLSTIHADDVESAIQRLVSKPMDVPPAFIPFLDIVLTVRRIAVPSPDGSMHAIRRIMSIDEVIGAGQYYNMFRWNQGADKHEISDIRGSTKLAKIAKDMGVGLQDIANELNKRSLILHWLQEKGIRNFHDVSAVLEEYASRSKEVYWKALKELKSVDPRTIENEGFVL
jgi:flagellar protein FlaI